MSIIFKLTIFNFFFSVCPLRSVYNNSIEVAPAFSSIGQVRINSIFFIKKIPNFSTKFDQNETNFVLFLVDRDLTKIRSGYERGCWNTKSEETPAVSLSGVTPSYNNRAVSAVSNESSTPSLKAARKLTPVEIA